MDTGMAWAWFVAIFITATHVEATITFHNNPGTVSMHENYDSALDLWTVSATCSYAYVSSYDCNCYGCNCVDCGWWGISTCCHDTCCYTCYQTLYSEATCTTCSISTNPSSIAEMNGDLTVRKKTCSSAGCGPTCSATGCVNSGESYSIGVTCYHTSHSSSTITSTFTLSVTQNAAPTFYFRHGAAINVYKSTNTGTAVNEMIATDSDSSVDGIYTIYYTTASGPGGSWIHNNVLFELDTTTAEIKVARSLDYEFSWYYSMSLCVHDRREDQTCATLSITLHACYQTPNCTDQSNLNVWDTYGNWTYGHGGDVNTLFTMVYPAPTDHFPNFASTWHELHWTLVQNDLTNSTIDYLTGEIYTVTNISIFPAYPSKDFTFVVDVGNSESCYTTQCTMSLRVWYTNWPIEIRSLDSTPTGSINEDKDTLTIIHSLIIFDYNYAREDNVTCEILSVSPSENNLFDLYNSGYNYNSWYLRKLACQTPDCGYKAANYLCATNIGCLNYDLTSQYVINIRCTDGYGLSDTDDFTLNIIENQAPVWTNLPMTIILNSDQLSEHDTVFSITYTDNEDETLYYEYTHYPTDYNFFQTSSSGNYYDNLGNITLTTHFWNMTVNSTYSMLICGHERRNEICETLTVKIQNYCGASPDCTPASNSVLETFAVGDTLFTVSSLVPNSGTFTGLSYSMATKHSDYFSMDASGTVTSITTLPASYPSTTYSINAYVYDTLACNSGVCTLTVTVTPVNYPITITNLPASVSIHEDTSAETTQFLVMTSDPDTDDTVECSISSTSYTQPAGDPDLFILRETIIGSDAFVLVSRENPGFSSATTTYSVTIQCEDSQGTTDDGVLTVEIELNQAPTITNLAASINVDPATIYSGTTLFTTAVSDAENDDITYACYIANTIVPLECITDTGVVRLKRNVSITKEDDTTFTITICVGDAKHLNTTCGVLTVNFDSSRTYPEISNLPSTVSFAEDTTIGTTIFDVDVTDPDVGDTHTISMSVNPSSSFASFQLDSSTGVLTTTATFDFESVASYTFTFSVKDQYLTGPDNKDLTLTITNVNEAPTLAATLLSITFAEDTTVGTALTDPQFNCSDPDISDTHTFSITSGTHASYFSINSATGVLSLAQVYDLESSLPTSTALVVTCTDAGGLSSNRALALEITAVNEMAPTVIVTSPYASYIELYANTSILEDLVTFHCSDDDFNFNGVCNIAILGDGTGASLFTIYAAAAGATATLRLAKTITLGYNANFSFTVKVSDGEANELFTGIRITAQYTAGDPTVEGATTMCVTCTSNGKVMIGFLCVEGVIISIIVTHIIVHCIGVRNKRKKESNGGKWDEVRNQKFQLMKESGGSVFSSKVRSTSHKLGMASTLDNTSGDTHTNSVKSGSSYTGKVKSGSKHTDSVKSGSVELSSMSSLSVNYNRSTKPSSKKSSLFDGLGSGLPVIPQPGERQSKMRQQATSRAQSDTRRSRKVSISSGSSSNDTSDDSSDDEPANNRFRGNMERYASQGGLPGAIYATSTMPGDGLRKNTSSSAGGLPSPVYAGNPSVLPPGYL